MTILNRHREWSIQAKGLARTALGDSKDDLQDAVPVPDSIELRTVQDPTIENGLV